MAAPPDKMRMAESKKDDNVVMSQGEDCAIAENHCLETSKKLDNISARENEQSKNVINEQKVVEGELQGKNIQCKECDNGKNYKELFIIIWLFEHDEQCLQLAVRSE